MATPSERRPFVDPVLALVLIAAALLLFWNLGGRDLWQDEAETAMLGRNILRFKLPVVFDGLNLVSSETSKAFGADLLWRWSPWLQFYAAAGSMALFGQNGLAARLPFALLGLLCLPLTFAFARRALDSVRIARWSAGLLALSVPFLLHCRQARWYAMSYLLVAGLFTALFSLERRPKSAAAALALCAALLFYTNYFVAIGLLASLCAALPVLRPGRPFLKRLALALAAAALCAWPGMVFFHILGKAEPLTVARVLQQLTRYLGLSFTQLLPLPVLAFLLWLLLRQGPQEAVPQPRRRRSLYLLACAGLYICYLALGPWALFRYLTPLLPITAVLSALAVDWLSGQKRLWGIAAALLLIGTDALHLFPLGLFGFTGTKTRDRFGTFGPFSLPLAGTVYEITHTWRDCSHDLAGYLKANARPTDVVLTTYGDTPLQFYTGLKIIGGFQGQKISERPDWIVVRSLILDRRPGRDLDVMRFIMNRIDLRRYERAPLRCLDFMLAGCTEPSMHLFREPAQGRELTLLRRTEKK